MADCAPQNCDPEYPGPEHQRWGQGAVLDLPSILPPIGSHPDYASCILDWEKWRYTYEGGEWFVNRYLEKFSDRENEFDFLKRRKITPIPAFAKGAINEIKNSIFQRMADITRINGSPSYTECVEGLSGGVDLQGASMAWFLGHHILPELLVMKKVGVYIDNNNVGPTLAQNTAHPYLYKYAVENIVNWTKDFQGRYTALRLREYQEKIDPDNGLPCDVFCVYRNMRLTDAGVSVTFTNEQNEILSQTILDLPEIPFVIFEISDSLIKDIANHQIALLNLESSDISYCLKANVPFYIEQSDGSNNDLIRRAQAENGVAPLKNNDEIKIGATRGRKYALNVNAPEFIHPSPEPLQASIAKQGVLKEDIRKLVSLALASLTPVRASAESKSKDQQGLESGLSYIGLELEHGERSIARIWNLYDGYEEQTVVNYPESWSVRSQTEISDSVKTLQSVKNDVPSNLLRKEINKRLADEVIAQYVSTDTLVKIHSEIDKAPGVYADIQEDVEQGLVTQKTASSLRSYADGEAPAAALEHAARLATIQQSQVSPSANNAPTNNPAARGNPDASVDPKAEAALEKAGKQGRGTA